MEPFSFSPISLSGREPFELDNFLNFEDIFSAGVSGELNNKPRKVATPIVSLEPDFSHLLHDTPMQFADPMMLAAASVSGGVNMESYAALLADPSINVHQGLTIQIPETVRVEAVPLPAKPASSEAPKKVSKPKQAEKASAPLDPSRTWSTVFVNDDIVKGGDVSIKIKTRRDQPSEAVPERLYSSIKYVFHLSATGFPTELPFILGRIRVVDAENFQIIKKNKKDVLKGVIEAALTKPPRASETQFEGSFTCQFTEVSYHVDKREFCYEVCFYLNEDLENPILIKRSAPYRTYARKPNKKRPKKGAEKRKRGEDEDDDEDLSEVENEEPAAKKQKTSPEFDTFVSKLDELVEQNKKLSDLDRRRALEVMMSKFLSIDPEFTCNLLLPGQNDVFSNTF